MKTDYIPGMPSLTALTIALVNIVKSIRDYEPEELTDEEGETPGVDVRLQVLAFSKPPRWNLWTGDPQFDTDHRGAWGFGFLPQNATREECKKIAEELRENAAESWDGIVDSKLI